MQLANDRQSANDTPSGPQNVLSFTRNRRFWKILTSHIDGMQRFKRFQGDGCMQFHPVDETGGSWKQVDMTSL
jgi:hypothetical protein